MQAPIGSWICQPTHMVVIEITKDLRPCLRLFRWIKQRVACLSTGNDNRVVACVQISICWLPSSVSMLNIDSNSSNKSIELICFRHVACMSSPYTLIYCQTIQIRLYVKWVFTFRVELTRKCWTLLIRPWSNLWGSLKIQTLSQHAPRRSLGFWDAYHLCNSLALGLLSIGNSIEWIEAMDDWLGDGFKTLWHVSKWWFQVVIFLDVLWRLLWLIALPPSFPQCWTLLCNCSRLIFRAMPINPMYSKYESIPLQPETFINVGDGWPKWQKKSLVKTIILLWLDVKILFN